MSPAWAHPEWMVGVVALVGGSVLLVAAARAWSARRFRLLLGREARLPWRADLALTLAMALVGVALLGPRVGEALVRVPATGLDLVVLMDVSRSMEARDVAPSRLVRAHEAARSGLGALHAGDRAALAAFADHGVLLTPLTSDHAALLELLPGLDTALMTDTGSRLETGLRAALQAFSRESLRPRLVLLLSDGEDSDGVNQPLLRELARADVRVVAVGLGTEQGVGLGTPGGVLRDDRGRAVHTRRELAGLERVARATGGTALAADAWGSVEPAALVRELRRDLSPAGDGTLERMLPVTRHATPAALALLLLLAELAPRRPRPDLAGAREGRARGPRAAAGWALLAVTVWLLPSAATPEPADQGLAGERPPEAAWLLSTGVERAQAGEPAEARRAFLAAAARARSSAEAALAYYDLGVAALELGELEAARDAFFDALALDPGDRQARFNLEWTLRALEEEPPPPESPSRRPPEDAEPEDSDASEAPEPDTRLSEEPREESTRQAEPSDTAGRGKLGEPPPALDPGEVERWLEAVQDDPRAALRPAARQGVEPDRQVRW